MPDGGCKPTHIGGQALIEGVMMRGKLNWAVAVRKPDGTIHTEAHDLPASRNKAWAKKPLIRGCVALWDSLSLSFKALEIAAKHAYAEEPAGQQPIADAPPKSSDEITAKEMIFAMAGGVLLAVVLFIVLPAFLTNLIVGEYGKDSFTWNVVDGLLRVAAFITYIWAISFMSDIKRMFAYHGAEHKTIHAHENGLPLTVEAVRDFTTLHVRCGTAFMLMAMLISIFVFTLTPVRPMIDAAGITSPVAVFSLVVLSRIVLVPLIAGIAYEVTVKWAGTRSHLAIVKIVLWPGLMLQKLTTKEPDDGMLEIAIAATELVIAREEAAEPAALVASDAHVAAN